MPKHAINRVSIPGRVWDYLWKDDEFYRQVCSNKRVSTSGNFPKCDQWADDDGFHMAFALAGYCRDDISIVVVENQVILKGLGTSANNEDLTEAEVLVSLNDSSGEEDLEYPVRTPSPIVQRGIIVRGIARRNFSVKYYIHPAFDPTKMSARMKNGLLELIMPKSEVAEAVEITVLEE